MNRERMDSGKDQSFIARLKSRILGGDRSVDVSLNPYIESSTEESAAVAPRRRVVRSSTHPYDNEVTRETSEFDVHSPSVHSTRVPQNQARADRYFAADGASDMVDRDDRFRDEDHLTNRSGDSRIGTHGRTYE